MSLGDAVLAGREAVSERSSATREPRSKPTALGAHMAGTQRDGKPSDPRAICTGTSLFEGGKQQVSASTAHAADLREREGLDTRDAYVS